MLTHPGPCVLIPVMKFQAEFADRAEEGIVWAQRHVEPVIRIVVPATPLDMHCHCAWDVANLHRIKRFRYETREGYKNVLWDLASVPSRRNLEL